ncbi:AGC protein kinase, partial [Cryptococcus bacillisporus CA1873]
MTTAVYHTTLPTLFASTFHSAAEHSSSHNNADPDPPSSLQQSVTVSKMTLVNHASVDVESGAAASLPEEACPIEEASDDIKKPSSIHRAEDRIQNPPLTPKHEASTSDASMKSNRYMTKLEDFELIRVLGKGCAGRVLLVKHSQHNTIHAMKAISKRSVFTHDELKRTMTEVSILRRIAVQEPHNRFVSKLHCSFTDQENFYFIMEFYPGGDLATQMEIYGVLGDHRTRFYASDITQGLEDLHRHGIIVRDLKPENILLNAKGHAVLADFGLSKKFAYRGDPKPVRVVTYPGQEELPVWAGKGAGSYRSQSGGGGKLVVDKAHGFVGTSEYLSPEVVKRGDYSYAVDWWALGCIVFEGVVGRVPFRKGDEDPPVVLWNKILYDSWNDCFRDPKLARYTPDQTTYEFIDALLQKDPMRRITEPYVKQHEYFSMIDWSTVQRGEYQDPHGLHIHPTAEYNTRYFPKLCLQEHPSVDMSTHDLRDYEVSSGKSTPMNDNALYKLELTRYRKELGAFNWSRDWETVSVGERECEMESEVGSDFIEEPVLDQGAETQGEVNRLIEGAADYEEDTFDRNLIPATSKGLSVPVDCPDPSESRSLHVPPTISPEDTPVGPTLSLPSTTSEFDAATFSPAATFGLPPLATEGLVNSILPAQPKANHEDRGNEVKTPFMELALKQLESLGIETTIATKNNTPMVKDAEVMSEEITDAQVKQLDDLSTDMESANGIQDGPNGMDNTDKSLSPSKSLSFHAPSNEELIPLVPAPPVPTSFIPPPIPAQPGSILDPLPSQAVANPHPLPITVYETPDLPTDLPLSGLSVSDVISARSLSAEHASPRLVRHHLRRNSEISIPLARLSVELHGTITRLEDEEWEELATNKEGIPAAPNGGRGTPYFFRSFTGLRHKPPTLVSSSLRRHYGPGSDISSHGSSASPTK